MSPLVYGSAWRPGRRGAVCALLVIEFAMTAFSKQPDAPVAGFPVDARLLTPLSSYSTKAGAPVEAVLATSVCTIDQSELPEGTKILGVVKKVHRVGLGILHETAGMQIEFQRLALPDGRSYPVNAVLTGVDNARERVDRRGGIHGIRATAAISNRVGERIALAVLDHPLAMLPLFAVETSLLHFPDPEIEYRRGAEFHISIDFPREFGPISRCAPSDQMSDAEWETLHRLVDNLPYWTYSKRQRQPMDPVNLMFIGSNQEVHRAFTAAGWTRALANSPRSDFKAMKALAEINGFAEAPMRTLLLQGEEPDFAMEKSLNTFEKRDHLRVWKRAESAGGQDVWVSAATRDLETTFSIRPFGFTHRIQDDVDLERDSIVSDLMFTGCVDSVAYVARPETVRTSGEAFRRGVTTDSRVAVIRVNSCEVPAEDMSDPGFIARPSHIVRWVRRVTLCTRNHFLRDNLPWRATEGVLLAVHTVRGWNQERRNERTARRIDARLAAKPELRRDLSIR